MKSYFLLIVSVLTGCEASHALEDAPANHVCSEEQMIRVEREAKWCTDNTDYFSSYCYRTAIMRVCQKRNLGGYVDDDK